MTQPDGLGDVAAAAAAILAKVKGMLWRLRPATVVTPGSTSSPTVLWATYDGDTKPSRVVSLIGWVPANARVMVAHVPPAGAYVVGWSGVPSLVPVVQTFTQPGIRTFVVPAGARWIRAYGVGGGGGGGGVTGASSGNGAAGGGGGGGYCESLLPASSLPPEVEVTVGAGGRGGQFGIGEAGGDSRFGSFWTAGGGGPGNAPPSVSTGDTVGGRGGGGTANGGNVLNSQGDAGDYGRSFDNRHTFRGRGGSSLLGQGAPASGSVNGNGNNATGWGGGGAGAVGSTVSRIGGQGKEGIVVVETYF